MIGGRGGNIASRREKYFSRVLHTAVWPQNLKRPSRCRTQTVLFVEGGVRKKHARALILSEHSFLTIGAAGRTRTDTSETLTRFCSPKAAARLERVCDWWARRESNPQSVRNTILSRARIPVPPLAQPSQAASISLRSTSSTTAASIIKNTAHFHIRSQSEVTGRIIP